METLESRHLLASDLTFSDPVFFPAYGDPGELVADDVNADGTLDLLVSSHTCCGNGIASVLLGNGDGTFASYQRVSLLAGSSIATADLDDNGFPDLISVRAPSAQGVYVALNKGIIDEQWQGFDRRIRFGMSGPTQDLSLGDFDNDGDIDAAIGHSQYVPVVLNSGTSDGAWDGFADPVNYQAGSHSSTVVNGDVDDDGDLDLVVANYFGGDISVLLGNGDGTFADAVNYPVANRGWGVRLADLDSDGDLDAALPTLDGGNVAILLNAGDGSFDDVQTHEVSRSGQIKRLAPGDFDADGDMDLVVADDVRLILLMNNGDGTFIEHNEHLRPTSTEIEGITVNDLDGDGDSDLAVALAFGSRKGVDVFWNTTEHTQDVTPGDVNGDGVFNSADLVIVFQAGEYEDATAGNSTFAEGDWDGDGDFTSSDLVFAFQNASYQATARGSGKQDQDTPICVEVTGGHAVASDGDLYCNNRKDHVSAIIDRSGRFVANTNTNADSSGRSMSFDFSEPTDTHGVFGIVGPEFSPPVVEIVTARPEGFHYVDLKAMAPDSTEDVSLRITLEKDKQNKVYLHYGDVLWNGIDSSTVSWPDAQTMTDTLASVEAVDEDGDEVVDHWIVSGTTAWAESIVNNDFVNHIPIGVVPMSFEFTIWPARF